MTPVFHPSLVNPPFEDPCVFVDFLFIRRAILFDLGTLTRLPARKILRTTQVFVTHTHIDHFIGFDHLLRLCLGREKVIQLYGPPGFVDQVGHRLAAYSWNLVTGYDTDFTIVVSEIHPNSSGICCDFHCLHGFRAENVRPLSFASDVIHEEDGLLVRAAFLDHKITSLAFSLEEKAHVNIMKNRLDEMGLAIGPWLKELKSAVLRGEPDDKPIRATPLKGGGTRLLELGELRKHALRVVAGQKICYVTDAGYTPYNAEKIIALAKGADYLFIEAAFPDCDAKRAAERHHLTAAQAGELARAADAARVIPFHFSPKYTDMEKELRGELERTWKGANPLFPPFHL